MSEEARNRLRRMGGIMASSPALIRAAGAQMDLPTVAPLGRGPRGTSFGPVPPFRPMPDRLPMATGTGTMEYLERVQQAQRALGPLTAGGGARQNLPAPDMPFEPRLPRGPEAGLPMRGAARALPGVMAGEGSEVGPRAAGLGPLAGPDLDVGIEELLRRSALPRPPASPERPLTAPPVPVEEEEGPVASPVADVLGPVVRPITDMGQEDKARATERALKALQPPRTDPKRTPAGGGGGGGGGAPSKRDLRARYKENIELFKEIYGVDDEEQARDRMMALAMMGLAIAAGQSPNALTNIAQGALVGLQGMSEMTADQRQRERDLRTAALETALSQQAAETGAEAAAEERRYDRETRLMVEAVKQGGELPAGEKARQEYLYNDTFRQTYTTALEQNPDDLEGALTKARRMAAAAAPLAPSAQSGGAVPASQAEVPVVTTKEEYDALPSGAEFMQNGTLRRKP